jgi:hypothetical protein
MDFMVLFYELDDRILVGKASDISINFMRFFYYRNEYIRLEKLAKQIIYVNFLDFVRFDEFHVPEIKEKTFRRKL